MCCGDPAGSNNSTNNSTSIVEEPLETRLPHTWSLPRPWTNASAGPSRPWSGAGFTGTRKKANQASDSFLKRSIPYVALGLDESGKNIIVDTITMLKFLKVLFRWRQFFQPWHQN